MSDLIRRSDAIKATIDYLDLLCKTKMRFHEDSIDYNKGIAESIFEDVPSVKPKRGEWIYNNLDGFKVWDCSSCGIHMETQWNFCPNCGARMKGADDE